MKFLRRLFGPSEAKPRPDWLAARRRGQGGYVPRYPPIPRKSPHVALRPPEGGGGVGNLRRNS